MAGHFVVPYLLKTASHTNTYKSIHTHRSIPYTHTHTHTHTHIPIITDTNVHNTKEKNMLL